jgi:hypothetical protein
VKHARRVLALALLLGGIAAYFSASESTRRYVKHLAKQAPYLPYRYFI